MMEQIIGLLVGMAVLAALVGIFVLQKYLSKCESKWPGLVLPGISLLLSVLMLFNFIMFSIDTLHVMEIEHMQRVDLHSGETINHLHDTGEIRFVENASITRMVLLFFFLNIPTWIFLAMYRSARGGARRKRKLDKMKLQDL